jgi:hypothetical protein
MAGSVVITIQVRFAWWFHAIYVPGIQVMAALGATPDPEKIIAVVRRAIRMRLVKRAAVLP